MSSLSSPSVLVPSCSDLVRSTMSASLVVETAQVWSTHHVATLIGYGASAVHPYMLFRVATQLTTPPAEGKKAKAAVESNVGIENARNALKAGVLKIMSKIGISTLSSYHGSRAVSFHCMSPRRLTPPRGSRSESPPRALTHSAVPHAVDASTSLSCRRTTHTRSSTTHRRPDLRVHRFTPGGRQCGLQGHGFESWRFRFRRVAKETASLVKDSAYGGLDDEDVKVFKLSNYGFINALQKGRGGEEHANSPRVAKLLHASVREDDPVARKNKYNDFVKELTETAPFGFTRFAPVQVGGDAFGC